MNPARSILERTVDQTHIVHIAGAKQTRVKVMVSKDPWRWRCPNKHADWDISNGDDSQGNYECNTCGVEFDDLLDMKGES